MNNPYDLLFQHKYQESADLFTALLNLDPDNLDYRSYLHLCLFVTDQQPHPFAYLPEKSYYHQYVIFALHALRQECQFEYQTALKLRQEIAKTSCGKTLNWLAIVEIKLRLGIYDQSCLEYLTNVEFDRINQTEARFLTTRLLNILSCIKHTYGIENIPEVFRSFCLEFLENQVLLDLENANYICSLGNFYYLLEEYEQSYAIYKEAENTYTNNSEACYGIASTYIQKNQLREAVIQLEQVLNYTPNFAKACLKYGILLKGFVSGEASLIYMQKAAQYLADHAKHNFQYASMFTALHHIPYAAQNYYQLIKNITDYQYAWYNLGVYWFEHKEYPTALVCSEKAINADPGDIANYRLQSDILLGMGLHAKSKHVLYQGIAINPGSWSMHLKAVESLHNTKQYQEASDLSTRFLSQCPEKFKFAAQVLATIVYLAAGMSDTAQEKLIDFQTEILNNSHSLSKYDWYFLYIKLMFIIPHLRDNITLNSKMYFLLGEKFVQEHINPILEQKELLPQSILFSHNTAQLKIGFISPHFANHPVGFLTQDILHELANLNAEVHVLPSSINCRDSQFLSQIQANQKLKLTELYTPILPSIAEIENLNLDVLIDLDSATSFNVSMLYAKSAKLCASWLGFDAPYISKNNYFLCDRYTHPEGVDSYYLEKLIRLPNSHMCIGKFDVIEADRDSVRSSLGIAPDQIVFLYCAAARKFNRQTAHAHIKILQDVPNSVLLRKGLLGQDKPQEVYIDECSKLNIDPTRIIALPRSTTEAEHRFYYLVADVCLDSYPYNGGSQNLEALWFNLPLVTYQGEQSFARMGYSLLATLGIHDGIANSWGEYINWGIRFGLDHDLRLQIKEKLTRSKQTDCLSPLWNPQKFAYDLYEILISLLRQ